MLLIVDSGATKACWRLILPTGEQQNFVGEGINPHHIPEAQIDLKLRERMPQFLQQCAVRQLFFYGAGCANKHNVDLLQVAFAKIFPQAAIVIRPDFLAAARALFANQRGVACILGTGAACCEYDGQEIVHCTHSLGYMLGDEGSATDLGKRLLRAFYYHLLPPHLEQALREMPTNREQTLQNLYNSPAPAAYLAGFVPFLLTHKNNIYIKQLIYAAFSDFIRWHVKRLYRPELQVGVVGSVAFLFSDIFGQAALEQGITQLQFLQYPINQLVNYHTMN